MEATTIYTLTNATYQTVSNTNQLEVNDFTKMYFVILSLLNIKYMQRKMLLKNNYSKYRYFWIEKIMHYIKRSIKIFHV